MPKHPKIATTTLAYEFMSYASRNAVPCTFYEHGRPIESRLSCNIYKIPYILQFWGFQYITAAVLAPILLISIFSRTIKESYRWFILNQAIWDLFIIINVNCDGLDFSTGEEPLAFKCFYDFKPYWWYTPTTGNRIVTIFFQNADHFALYAPMFLLAFSRFICLYFNHFYKRHKHPLRLLCYIFIFQALLLIYLNLCDWVKEVDTAIFNAQLNVCSALGISTEAYNNCTDSLMWYDKRWWLPMTQLMKFLTPPLLLLFSDTFALLIIYKLIKNFKFQSKVNRTRLLNSLKIACVIAFQCVYLSILFVFTVTKTLADIFYFPLPAIQMPSWIKYLTANWTVQWLYVIRIFCDSILMMLILTEYRQTFTSFVEFVISKLTHSFQKLSTTSSNEVEDISIDNGRKSFRSSSVP